MVSSTSPSTSILLMTSAGVLRVSLRCRCSKHVFMATTELHDSGSRCLELGLASKIGSHSVRSPIHPCS
eukprot:5874030-Pleurochrysis_carterae.AAC.2